jgi:hypothetical protein
MMTGPKTYPSRKMEVTRVPSVLSVELKWAKMSRVAAALIVEVRGLHGTQVSYRSQCRKGGLACLTHERSVIIVTMARAVVFRAVDQFSGFSGSSGPSKSTMLGSLGAGSVKTSSKDAFSSSWWVFVEASRL